MILHIEHDILVSGPDLPSCDHRVRLFFEKSQLVHYDSIEFDLPRCLNGTDTGFAPLVEEGVAANRQVLDELLGKLRDEGIGDLQDILTVPQGFQSKVLHTISHLLDGFFGIDSRLYDIDEMSHWITDNRKDQLDQSPETCWLLRVKAELAYGQGFEKESD